MEKLIKRGAEADILLGEWAGCRAVLKVRKSRKYLLKDLDDLLRRQRTVKEAELIKEAKEANVRSPTLYFVNLRDSTIIMEYLPGKRLRDLLRSDVQDAALWCRRMGYALGKLHQGGIVHGDPTTSNFIINDNEIAVLDFGLAFKSRDVEDRAVDLHLVKEVLSGDHPKSFPKTFDYFSEGYRAGFGEGSEGIFKRARQIEQRGRYARSSWGE